jgi:hypothetical protein
MHTPWMRRGALLALVAGLAALGTGWLALSASGRDGGPAPAAPRVAQAPAAE